MRILIKQELKKFIANKRNWIVLSIIIVTLVSFVLLNAKLDSFETKNIEANITMNIQSTQDEVLRLEKELSLDPTNQNVSGIIKSYKNEMDLLYKMQFALLKKDWEKYLVNKIELDTNFLTAIEQGEVLTSYPVQDLKDEIAINERLLKEQITPIHTMYSMQGYNFMTLYLQYNTIIILLVAVIYFTSSIISSEFESGTYKLLYTQPISKIKIYCAKFFSAVILNFLWITIIVGSSFCVLSIIYGIGDINYPTKILLDGVVTYIPVGKYIMYSLVAVMLFVIFIVNIVLLISLLVRNTTFTIALTCLVFGGLSLLNSQGIYSEWMHLNPISYVDITNILKGNIVSIANNPNVTIEQLFIVFPIFISILIVCSLITSRKMKLNG